MNYELEIEKPITYKGCYIAVPLPGIAEYGYQLSTGFLMGGLENTRVYWDLPHITIWYIGQLLDLDKVAQSMARRASILKDKEISYGKMGTIGQRGKNMALVYHVGLSGDLNELRHRLEQDLPEYQGINLPFQPHLTINLIESRRTLRTVHKLIQKQRSKKATFVPKKLVLYAKDKTNRYGVRAVTTVDL